MLAGIGHTASRIIGRRPEAGLLLLRDLRQLYLMAQESSICWIALGQLAQAVRDQDLLDQVSALHEQLSRAAALPARGKAKPWLLRPSPPTVRRKASVRFPGAVPAGAGVAGQDVEGMMAGRAFTTEHGAVRFAITAAGA